MIVYAQVTPLERLRLYQEQPKDRGTRRLAARLALAGHALTQTQIADTSQPYCDDPVPILRTVRAGGYDRALEVTMFRPCRKCVKCLQFKQMRWRQRAQVEIESSTRTWFLTLTFAPSHLAGIIFEAKNVAGNPERAIERAAYSHVQRYLKRIRKTTKARFRYLAIYERGEETGRSHYHLLLHEGDRPVTKSVLERQWRSNVHCRLVTGDIGAARYVTKYVTKSATVRPRSSAGYGSGAERPTARQGRERSGGSGDRATPLRKDRS